LGVFPCLAFGLPPGASFLILGGNALTDGAGTDVNSGTASLGLLISIVIAPSAALLPGHVPLR
jgi:hypothetical protein